MEISDDDNSDAVLLGKKALFDSVKCDMTHDEAIINLVNARLVISVMAINLLSPDDWEDIKEQAPGTREEIEKAFNYRELLAYCIFMEKKRQSNEVDGV